ncbi:unnamed protein product, partial [Prunus brigantina]
MDDQSTMKLKQHRPRQPRFIFSTAQNVRMLLKIIFFTAYFDQSQVKAYKESHKTYWTHIRSSTKIANSAKKDVKSINRSKRNKGPTPINSKAPQ